MTTDKYINENKTTMFKKGDEVIMHTCHESTLPIYKNKIWICLTDSFLARSKEEVVFLDGFSGYFSAKFLKLKETECLHESKYIITTNGFRTLCTNCGKNTN